MKTWHFIFTFFFYHLPGLAQIAPAGAHILNVLHSGSGCDFEQVTVSLSPDARDLSVLFSNYTAEIGLQSTEPHLLQKIKDCLIDVQLSIPTGWQMAFHAVDYRGFALLPQYGVSAFHRLVIQQDGAAAVSMQEAQLTGPLNDDYFKRVTVRPERVTWSPCLHTQTRIRLGSQLGIRLNPRAPVSVDLAMIGLDSADTSFQQTLSVLWRKCQTGFRPPRTNPVVPRPPRYRGR